MCARAGQISLSSLYCETYRCAGCGVIATSPRISCAADGATNSLLGADAMSWFGEAHGEGCRWEPDRNLTVRALCAQRLAQPH